LKATYKKKKYILNFKRPSGTSRGVLTEKETGLVTRKGKCWNREPQILRTAIH
jgi:hypothetical protein